MAYEDLPGGTGPGGDYADQDEWTPAIATVVRDNFIDHQARITTPLIGTRAAQPLATAVPAFTLYAVTDENNLIEYSTGSAWATYHPGSFPGTVIGASVSTDEAQTSNTTWGDLATVGPRVTKLMTGTVATITLSAKGRRPGGGGGFTGWIGVGVTGASTIPMANGTIDSGAFGGTMVGSAELMPTRINMQITGITPGVNIFTMKYQNDGGGTWNFRNRMIWVSAP